MTNKIIQNKIVQIITVQIRDLVLWQMFACAFFYKIVFTREGTFLAFPDASIQSFAWFAKLSSAWRNLELPLWDFAINSGTSFVGELQTAPFYPLNILFAWIAPPANQYSLDLFIVFHYGLAAYFMYVFLKINKINKLAAILGAIIYAFVGTVALKASAQPNIFFGMAYLPISIALFQKGLESNKILWKNAWLYLCGFSLALTLMAGHAQPLIHSVVALFFLLFFTLRYGDNSIRRRIGKLIFTGAVSVFAASIQIVPTIEYLAKALRWVGAENPIRGLQRAPYDVYATHEILQPNQLFQIINPLFDIKDGAMLFVTISGLILVIFGCFAKHQIKWFAIILAVFALIFALGHYTFVGSWSWYVPILSSVREPVRMLFLYHFSLSFLAALGGQFLIEKFNGQISVGKQLKTIFYFILIGLVCYESYSVQNRLFSKNGEGLTPNTYYADNETIQFLKNRLESENHLFRILNYKEPLPKNIGYVHGIPTTQGHRATMQRNYFEYLSRDWGLTSVGYDKLSAKYVVSSASMDNFKLIFQKNGLYIYERPKTLPIFRVENSEGIQDVKISKVKWTTNTVEFDLENSAAGDLVFAQPYYYGWKAYIDGESHPIEKYDELTSLKLKGGEQHIKFVYAPFYIWICLGLMLIALIGLGYSLFTSDFYNKKT